MPLDLDSPWAGTFERRRENLFNGQIREDVRPFRHRSDGQHSETVWRPNGSRFLNLMDDGAFTSVRQKTIID
jgi:hypothetical protein